MFRMLLFALGAAVAACVALFLWTGRSAYLRRAGRILLAALGVGVVFFAVLLVKRLI